jgi:RNA polymerase sigma factor (sigma-70 family)
VTERHPSLAMSFRGGGKTDYNRWEDRPGLGGTMPVESGTAGLVERIRLGESEAEAELVERFHCRIFAMALARTGDREVARDLAQEVMISVLCALREGRLHNHDGLAGYICTTTRNRISYYFRGRSQRNEVALPAEVEIDLPDPEQCFDSAERSELAQQAIQSLKASDRTLLQLSLIDGLSPAEIAAGMGLSSEVVRKRKSRALRHVREVLRKKGSRFG